VSVREGKTAFWCDIYARDYNSLSSWTPCESASLDANKLIPCEILFSQTPNDKKSFVSSFFVVGPNGEKIDSSSLKDGDHLLCEHCYAYLEATNPCRIFAFNLTLL
jgi:hypothetical protein